jgi:hypothetical protein
VTVPFFLGGYGLKNLLYSIKNRIDIRIEMERRIIKKFVFKMDAGRQINAHLCIKKKISI